VRTNSWRHPMNIAAREHGEKTQNGY
jgi:hypothetical protein